MTNTIRIATRGSALALWQAHFVKDQLTSNGHSVELQTVSTKGDRVQNRFLHEIGGKGLFIRELETTLLSGECHIAVHSLKDLPAKLPEPFALSAILTRHAHHDVLVLNPNKHKDGSSWPTLNPKTARERLRGCTIGTSSLRRRSLLCGLDAEIETIAVRGNVDTRIAKLKASDLDGIILAGASLARLGIDDVTAVPFDPAWFVPCAGQGALAIEAVGETSSEAGQTWTEDSIQRITAALAPLDHATSHFCVDVEREVLHLLGGDCTMPAGIHVQPKGPDSYGFHAVVLDYEGKEARCAGTQAAPNGTKAADMAKEIFESLQAAGAATIIERLGQTEPPQFPLLDISLDQ